MKTTKKPWQGRFKEPTDSFTESFTASISFDQRLYYYDILASRAHAQMLHKVGVFTSDELQEVLSGLDTVLSSIETGELEWSDSLEDVHMNIESWLIDKIGEPAKKLHTGRSRNDQVVTDLKLFLRDHITITQDGLKVFQKILLDLADSECETIIPGFTHLQIAQPVILGHYFLAWFEMIQRDIERLDDCYERVNVMPLGSAALSGSNFDLDRVFTAELLGFKAITKNSIDTVSDRDFVIEFISVASIIMTHFSRFSEEIILWASSMYQFIELPDRFCTGSSIMPQKKNPDMLELIRGKSGRVFGDLISILTIMKAQPFAYNRDNQEDKPPLFDTVDTVLGCLQALIEILPNIKINHEMLEKSANLGYSTATDLADYLAKQGIPFREAHEIVGKIVALAISKKKSLHELDIQDYRSIHSDIDEKIISVTSLQNSVQSKNTFGGTSPNEVKKQIKAARKLLA